MPTIRIAVTGRVQGVGFRAFVLRCAIAMGVRGEVANRQDGSVEAFAVHEDASVLERFEEAMQNGPGRVDKVSAEAATAREYRDFSIS